MKLFRKFAKENHRKSIAETVMSLTSQKLGTGRSVRLEHAKSSSNLHHKGAEWMPSNRWSPCVGEAEVAR